MTRALIALFAIVLMALLLRVGELPVVSAPVAQGPAASHEAVGRTVHLTFDDGPDPVETPKILDLLRQYNVKATFCLVGKNAKRYPELVDRIYWDGHTLCNHTWDHDLNLSEKTPEQIKTDLQRTNKAIHYPVSLFRAPGGNFDEKVVGVAQSLGMSSIYWSVDTRDWDGMSTDAIVQAVKENVESGGIILTHDVCTPNTVEAYKTLLPWLKERFDLAAL